MKGRAYLGAGDVKRLLAEAGVRPSKYRGQNFLADPNIVRRIVRTAGVVHGDRVLEVGVGLGSLTVGLLDVGAAVVGLEVDAGLADVARGVAPGADIRVADATAVDWAALLAGGDWSMVANLPYSVGTRVLLEILETAPMLRAATVMVQREVGERLAAGPGQAGYGAVSVKVAYYARAGIAFRVPPSVFVPQPEVDSVVVRVERHAPPVAVEPRALFAVVEAGFAQRRKTLRSALRARWGQSVEAALEAAAIEGSRRAETLSLAEFGALATLLPAPPAAREDGRSGRGRERDAP